MNDETKISISFNNKVLGEDQLKQFESRLKNIYSYLSAMNTGQAKTISNINTKTKELNDVTKKTTESTEKMAKGFNTAFNVTKLSIFYNTMTKMFTSMMKYVSASSAYIENINLLEVAYSNANETIEESSQRVEKFISKMSEVYGLDESNLTRQFGIFKQLANAMQLPTETAENLSELMVKMTNDIASLYNLDISRASNALQSALAGQVRPIRGATGADITEKTLQQTVEALDLTRNISQLSYAEKRLIMVISLTNQLKNSQGDWGRTIESTSNQIRIMQEQWSRLTRAVGNTFYPLLSKILPYVNAILMALTEIFNIIASLLGFEMPSFDYSGLSSTADAVLDLEDDLNGASASADKLSKKLSGLRGFDKLNVINTPSKGSSGSGGGASGIDPKIMEAFNDVFANYNDMLDQTKMKATAIRDRIMEWLGFTKLVNEETGKISWKYNGSNEIVDGVLQTVKKIIPYIKEIWTYSTKIFSGVLKQFFKDIKSGLYGKLMEAALKLVTNILKMIANNQGMIKIITRLLEAKLIVNFFKTILKFLPTTTKAVKGLAEAFGYKNTGLGGIIKSLFSPITDLFGLFKISLADTSKSLGERSTEAWNAWSKNLSGLDKVKLGIVGAGGLLASIGLAIDGFKDLARAGEDSFGAIAESAVSVAGGAISGAMIGTAIAPGVGTAVGAVAGGITTAIAGLMAYFDELEKIRVEDILFDSSGLSITEFIDNVTDSIGKVGEYSNKYYEATSKISSTKDDIVGTYDEIKAMTTEFGNLYKVLDQDDLDRFNDTLKNLTNSVEEHWQAVVTSTAIITDKLKERGYLEEETAIRIMNATVQIAKVQGDAAKEYETKMQTLAYQLKTGRITLQKYNEEVAKLNKEFGKTNTTIDDTRASINLTRNEISRKINFKDWDLAKTNIQKLGKEYSNTRDEWIKAKEQYIEGQKEVVEAAQKIVDEAVKTNNFTGESYKQAQQLLKDFADEVDGYDKMIADDSKEMRNIITEGLEALVKQLYQAGYDIEEDSEGIVSTINDQFKEIGSEETVGSVIAKNFANSINGIPTNPQTGQALTNVKKYFTKQGEEVWGPAMNPANYFDSKSLENSGTKAGETYGSSMASALQKQFNKNPLDIQFKSNTIQITTKNGTVLNSGTYQGATNELKIFKKADGGLPPVGQLFVANERGPELIGQIGGKTFVANQKQMMDLLDKKIGNAQNSKGTQIYNIYLDENHKIGTYTLEQLQGMAKTNGKPITIG